MNEEANGSADVSGESESDGVTFVVTGYRLNPLDAICSRRQDPI